jgi:outer membrane lipoprotein-sorting protein
LVGTLALWKSPTVRRYLDDGGRRSIRVLADDETSGDFTPAWIDFQTIARHEIKENVMKKKILACGAALVFLASITTAGKVVEQMDAAAVIARCAEAMGGEALIKNLRTLRAEVVYPDHDTKPVLHEIRRPNLLRTERTGEYTAIFDGKQGAMMKYDPAKPGQPPTIQNIPSAMAKGLETDLIWFIPAFFDFPAEYAGLVESNGRKAHKLKVTLPLGTRAEYLIDAETYLIKTIAVDETYQGKTFHMERGWLDLKSAQGILYPGRMSYAGQGGKTAVAEIRKIEFNPVLDEDRFKIPAVAK